MEQPAPLSRALTRKQFLRLSAGVGIGAGAALLAACGVAAPPANTSVVAAPASTSVAAAPVSTSVAAAPVSTTVAVPTGAPVAAAAAPTGTLTVATGFDPNSLSPFVIQGVFSMGRTIYDQLVVRDAQSKIVPSLATSWEQLSDTKVQFKLRQGVTFHNGEPFTAAAVKWSLEQFVAPETKNPYANTLSRVIGTEIVDDFTINMLTDGPFPLLLENLAYGFMIGPPKTMQSQGDAFVKNPVGTGAFKFVSWTPGDKFVVEATGAPHFNGAAQIKSVVFQPSSEAASRVTALRAGQADIINNVAPPDLPSISDQPGINVFKVPSQSFLVLIMNTGRPPFDNKLVRQAMNFAVDKQGIIQSLLRGEGTVLAAPMGPATEGYDPNLKPIYDYDPAKATQLLTSAGYPNGFNITLITPVGRYVQDKQIAEAIAGQFGKIGVKTAVQTFEGSYSKLKQGDWPDIMLIQQGGSSTDNLYPACFSSKVQGLPWLNYTNPDADALMDQAGKTTDAVQRNALYQNLARLLQEDAPWVYLHYQTNIFGVRDRVKGFEPRSDMDIIVQPMSVA